MKKQQNEDLDTMRDEYHFDYSKAETGKYYKRMIAEGHVPVMLDPDVFAVFPDSESVNAALRGLIEIAERANAADKKPKSHKRLRAGATRRAVKE